MAEVALRRGSGRLYRCLLIAVSCASIGLVNAASAPWLDRVQPIITPAEKKTYLSMSPQEKRAFEDQFFATRAITAQDYFDRLSRVDATFGSSKPGSGANTDQGRVYLALGAPTKITRLPSSRIFVPLEIWYYDTVPGVLNTELRLIFFQKNLTGFPKLYSPQTDTIRALLLPEPTTRLLFGPNDSASEADIRGSLTVPPAEDEVITAAVGVASGVKDVGNQEILGLVASPAEMLNHPPKTEVRSRLVLNRPKLETLITPSPYGGAQVDLAIEVTAQHGITVELFDKSVSVYRNQLRLDFSKPEAVVYSHRFDLLSGAWRVEFTVDGKTQPYVVDVPQSRTEPQIVRADLGVVSAGRETPFLFGHQQVEVRRTGRYAVLPLATPGRVTWRLRRGNEVVWHADSDGEQIATLDLSGARVPPGEYRLDAITESSSASTDVEIVRNSGAPEKSATLVSFNANLRAADRMAFVGHQWLLRNKPAEARKLLEMAIAQSPESAARIELARLDALEGRLDAARERVRGVLASNPRSFEALTVFAYIETRLQDYQVAADLYRRALEVQDSPVIRSALANLPSTR